MSFFVIMVDTAPKGTAAVPCFVSVVIVVVYTAEESTVTMPDLITFGIIVVNATKESGTALANLLPFGIVVIDLSEQTFRMPRMPRNRLETNIPLAQMVSQIPRVALSEKERIVGSARI